MVIGHVGIAFEAKVLRPRASLIWLIGASFLPDITRLLFEPFADGFTLNLLSHSIPAIAIQAAAIAGLCRVNGAAPKDALAFAIVCSTHWPLDVITGCKATWPSGPVVGLALYQSPLLDLPIEVTLLGAAWAFSRKSFPDLITSRWWFPGVMILVQLAALVGINAKTGFFYAGGIAWRWTPTESVIKLSRMPPPPSLCPQPGHVSLRDPSDSWMQSAIRSARSQQPAARRVRATKYVR